MMGILVTDFPGINLIHQKKAAKIWFNVVFVRRDRFYSEFQDKNYSVMFASDRIPGCKQQKLTLLIKKPIIGYWMALEGIIEG